MSVKIFGLGITSEAIQWRHTLDTIAVQECEFMVGLDGIARLNVDGRCLIRIRLGSVCQVKIDTPVELISMDRDLIINILR